MSTTVLFGVALQRIITAKRMPASELSRRMGLKSKTALFRVLNDNCQYKTVAKFYEALLRSDALALTPQELQTLENALEVTRVGAAVYQTNLEMRSLLKQQPSNAPAIQVTGLAETSTLPQLCMQYAMAQQVNILLIGLCDQGVVEALHTLMRIKPSHHSVHIQHIVYSATQTTDIIRHIGAMMPLLFSPAYQVYTADAHKDWIFLAEMMLVEFTDGAGAKHYHHLLKSPQSMLHGIAYDDPAAFLFWKDFIDKKAAVLSPLKTAFDVSNAPEDYLDYTESYRQLEHNRNIYTLKPDIPLNFVSPDILMPLVMESFPQTGFLPDADPADLLEAMYNIHKQRFDNFFTKKKVTHTIFSQSDMIAFAKTGLQSDHFFAMRPYTPQERVQILSFCMEQHLQNPYFFIYFAKADELVKDAEISCYDGAGTLILNAHSAYNLADDHVQVLLTQPAFSEHFRIYFLTEVLQKHVLPQGESMAFMEYLISLAKA